MVIKSTAASWVAAGSQHGHDLALEWIESDDEDEAATGWATLCGLVSTTDDAELDLAELKRLLDRVQTTIHEQPNRVRYMMNSFVIALGCYVRDLTKLALAASMVASCPRAAGSVDEAPTEAEADDDE